MRNAMLLREGEDHTAQAWKTMDMVMTIDMAGPPAKRVGKFSVLLVEFYSHVNQRQLSTC
jgi:hypothetical protein